MTDTVAVLALDAADYELARRWDCQHLLLDDHRRLETFAYSLDHPYTPEVWATVATGVGPETHGIGAEQHEYEWDNPVLRLASHVTARLPSGVRQTLGRPFRAVGASQSFNRVSDAVSHPFDDVLGWPGISDAEHLRTAWRLADEAHYGDLTEAELARGLQRLAGQELGYLATLADTDATLIGTHTHTLDVAGHVYSERPARLREWYEWMDSQVARLRDRVDRLVLLSDHGMQTTATDDDSPGDHSWRAYISAQGLDGPLPGDVHDVRAYLEDWADAPTTAETGRVQVDTPTETLENLGYLDA